MPYGIVLIKEIPEHWRTVAEVLNECSLQKNGIEMFKKTNTALLNWYRCFGWADFIAIVWSPNVECIKNWVLEFRNCACSKVGLDNEPKVPITTTIICVAENEFKNRQNELKRFRELISSSNEDKSVEALFEEFNLIRLKEFLENLKKEIESMISDLK